MSDDENRSIGSQTSDYFSESTPKSCQSICLDHKYALSPTLSLITCSTTSSSTSLTPNQLNEELIKRQKKWKPRKLFDSRDGQTKRTESKVTPLSERQQLSIALKLSSDQTKCDSNHTNSTLIQSNNVLKSSTQRVRRNHKGETDLHIAAIKGDLKRVRQIIGRNQYDVDITDFAGWAPIHEACNRGFISIVQELLNAGSDVNVRGYNSDTPLIDASVNGHYLLVDLLLKYGADYTLRNNRNQSAIEVARSVRVLEVFNSFIDEKMRKNGNNNRIIEKDIVNAFGSKSRSSSPSSSPSPLKPSSPRLTLRIQTIKDCKQTTTFTNTANTSSSAMASTKTYSVSTALDKDSKEVINDSNSDKQSESKSITSNGSASDSVTASSDHNYTSVDSTLTAASDESSRGRKRRKSNDGSVSSTSATSGGPSPRSGSTSSVGSSTSNSWHNRKHHHQHQHPHHPHHHHVNHSNKSNNNRDKSVKKLFSSSSDSEGIEGSECDKEANLKDTNTSNANSSNNSNEANAPKVPPLRIVLPANTSIGGTTSAALIATTAATSSGAHFAVSSTVTSSTTTSGAKFPYVVSSEESFQSESECVSGAVGSQRITRSSQRVAQQQSQKSASGEHHSDSEESALHTSQTDAQHPRKRKIRNNNNTIENRNNANNANNSNNNSVNTNSNSNSNGDNDNDSTSSTSSVNGLIPKDVSPFALPQTNCYQMFLSIRKNVDKKRKEMFSVQPKAPQNFDHYLINRGSYILEGKDIAVNKANGGGISTVPKPTLAQPPKTLTSPRMHEVFNEQERHRHKLKVQHLIERQKLVLSAEQEILRVHGRAARAMANQQIPFSVCSILKDEEIYNIFDSETNQNESITNQLKSEKPVMTSGTSGLSANRTRYNGRLFLSWHQDVVDKWEKIKEGMLLRHRKESESLLAMQKLEWEWKLKEFGLCDVKVNPNIDDKHVPKVEVNDDFELFPV